MSAGLASCTWGACQITKDEERQFLSLVHAATDDSCSARPPQIVDRSIEALAAYHKCASHGPNRAHATDKLARPGGLCRLRNTSLGSWAEL